VRTTASQIQIAHNGMDTRSGKIRSVDDREVVAHGSEISEAQTTLMRG
jgi:hypothetical protein